MAPAGGRWVRADAQAIWQGWPTIGCSRDSRATTGPQALSRCCTATAPWYGARARQGASLGATSSGLDLLPSGSWRAGTVGIATTAHAGCVTPATPSTRLACQDAGHLATWPPSPACFSLPRRSVASAVVCCKA